MRPRTLPRAVAAVVLVAASCLAGQAQPARGAAVVVERVRLLRGDRQAAWVSVLDDQGRAVTGLGRDRIHVEHDGREVTDLEVEAFADRYDGLALEVLVDPELLRGTRVSATERAIEELGGNLTSDDRLRLVRLTRPASLESGTGSQAGELLERLRADEERGAPDHHLYDALFDAIRRAGGAGSRRAGHVLLVTGSEAEGSTRGVIDVQVRSRLAGDGVPVSVVLVGNEAGGVERERLASLVARTGGVFRAVDGPARLADALRSVAVRMRSAYRLSYRVRGWDPEEDRHALAVSVATGGGTVRHRLDYVAGDVAGGSSQAGLLPWLAAFGVALLMAAGFRLSMRRRICRLVVASGPQRGCSYEVFGLPVTVGAAEGNDLVLPDPWVSRHHAVFERRGSAVELVDQNSENGTYVNGNRVTRFRLSPGDRIDLGGAIHLNYQGRG